MEHLLAALKTRIFEELLPEALPQRCPLATAREEQATTLADALDAAVGADTIAV